MRNPTYITISDFFKIDWDNRDKESILKYKNKLIKSNIDGIIIEKATTYSHKKMREFNGNQYIILQDNKNIKLADGTNTNFDSNNSDIRYELGGEMKQPNKDLVVLHNINPYQIIEIDKLGGMVTPSIAILKAGESYTDFGEITLIGDKELIDPTRQSVRVFAGDVYSPSVPIKLYRVSPELDKKGQELSIKAYSSDKYRIFGGDISNLIQDYGSVYKDMSRLSKDDLIERYYEDMRLVYLIDKNIDFDIPYKKEKKYLWGNQELVLNKSQKERAKELLKKYDKETKGSSRDVKETTTKAIYDLYWEIVYDIKKEELKDFDSFVEEDYKQIISERYKALFENLIGDETWINIHSIDKLKDTVSPKIILDKDGLKKSIKRKFTPELELDYKKWINDFVKKYQGYEYFEKGSQKIPYNLENLVDATSSAVRGQEKSLTYSQNKAKSYSSKEFKTLEDIKKYSDRLVSKEKMNEIDEENKEGFRNLYERLNYEYESAWNGLDSLAKSLADYYKGKSAIQALMKNDFRKPTSTQLYLFEEYAKKLKNSPVDYFEAKIQRAVKLSEFKYAVVPIKTIPKVIEILKKNGLIVKFYNPKIENDRMNVVNKIIKNPDMRFNNGGIVNNGTSEINLTLTSEQVENKLGRKLHWWNDDVVNINGIEYKKVFLKPEYKRL